MPSLPPDNTTLQGGCFCSAIQYQINIPPQADRPLVPGALPLPEPRPATPDPTTETEAPSNAQAPRYPLLELDHCSSCRRACGSLIQAWIVIPVSWVSFSLTPKLASPPGSNVGPPPGATATEEETPEHAAPILQRQSYPAAQLVKPPTAADIQQQTYLGSYSSNGASWRTFCTRCGTGLTFFYSPLPSSDEVSREGGASSSDGPAAVATATAAVEAAAAAEDEDEVMDVALGTLARECLAQPWLRPQRHSHWASGTVWIKDMLYGGTGRLPRHPAGMPTEVIEEDRWMLQQQTRAAK